MLWGTGREVELGDGQRHGLRLSVREVYDVGIRRHCLHHVLLAELRRSDTLDPI